MGTDSIFYLLFLALMPVGLVYGYRRVQKTGRISDFYGLFPIDRKEDPEGFKQWVALAFFFLWFGYAVGVLAFFFPPPWTVPTPQFHPAPPQP